MLHMELKLCDHVIHMGVEADMLSFSYIHDTLWNLSVNLGAGRRTVVVLTLSFLQLN